MEMPVQSSSSKMEGGEEGGGGGNGLLVWQTIAPCQIPPFPLLPTSILLYSPGLCDDKSSLTDQLTSFPTLLKNTEAESYATLAWSR